MSALLPRNLAAAFFADVQADKSAQQCNGDFLQMRRIIVNYLENWTVTSFAEHVAALSHADDFVCPRNHNVRSRHKCSWERCDIVGYRTNIAEWLSICEHARPHMLPHVDADGTSSWPDSDELDDLHEHMAEISERPPAHPTSAVEELLFPRVAAWCDIVAATGFWSATAWWNLVVHQVFALHASYLTNVRDFTICALWDERHDQSFEEIMESPDSDMFAVIAELLGKYFTLTVDDVLAMSDSDGEFDTGNTALIIEHVGPDIVNEVIAGLAIQHGACISTLHHLHSIHAAAHSTTVTKCDTTAIMLAHVIAKTGDLHASQQQQECEAEHFAEQLMSQCRDSIESYTQCDCVTASRPNRSREDMIDLAYKNTTTSRLTTAELEGPQRLCEKNKAALMLACQQTMVATHSIIAQFAGDCDELLGPAMDLLLDCGQLMQSDEDFAALIDLVGASAITLEVIRVLALDPAHPIHDYGMEADVEYCELVLHAVKQCYDRQVIHALIANGQTMYVREIGNYATQLVEHGASGTIMLMLAKKFDAMRKPGEPHPLATEVLGYDLCTKLRGALMKRHQMFYQVREVDSLRMLLTS